MVGIKKVITLICTAILAAGLVSCDSGKSSSSDTSISDVNKNSSSDRETPDDLPDDYLEILEKYVDAYNSNGEDYLRAALPDDLISSMKKTGTYDTVESDMDAYAEQLRDRYKKECGENVNVKFGSVRRFKRLSWMQLDGVQLYYEALAYNYDTRYYGAPALDGYEAEFSVVAEGDDGSFAERFCFCAVQAGDGSYCVVEWSGDQLEHYMESPEEKDE